jgi:hypothetical protein
MRPIDAAAEFLVSRLGGESDESLGEYVSSGREFRVMVGTHGSEGECWCQPRVTYRITCMNRSCGDLEHVVFTHSGTPN